ncbi:cytochrome P450 [Actinomadura barringtoniae]|uniref:Cytochrome P450 n=1 Tax=Actinomadura barringtoniae TaxID=1427535 RepID=A0A939T6H5_9ACTN|nr:cytochrome P450 [Actinomadura barringtoniae]MBO2448267.1 cytochrome P450 [Actinomadura barringtoniae]
MPQRRGALPISDAEVLGCPDTYVRGVPYDSLDRLRAKTPVVWLDGRLADEPGSWAVLRYDDVRRALSRPELFTPVLYDALHGPVYDDDRTQGHPDGGEEGGGEPEAAAMLIDMEPPARAMLSRVTGTTVDFIHDVLAEMPETMRNTLAGGVYALLRNPDQYARLRAAKLTAAQHEGDGYRGDGNGSRADGDGHRADGDAYGQAEALLDSAVEEMLRWWTPVLHVRRLVRRNTVMGGVPLLAGEHVSLWLTAANHDEAAFAQPTRFVPERFLEGTDHHLSFGQGTRACLGARLARVHLRAMINAVLERPGRLEPAGEAVPVRSIARHGFERLPVRWANGPA